MYAAQQAKAEGTPEGQLPAAVQSGGEAVVRAKFGFDGAANGIMPSGSATTASFNMMPWAPEERRHAQSVCSCVVVGQYDGGDSHELLRENWGQPGGLLEAVQAVYDGRMQPKLWLWGRWWSVRVRLTLGADMKAQWELLHTGGLRTVRVAGWHLYCRCKPTDVQC